MIFQLPLRRRVQAVCRGALEQQVETRLRESAEETTIRINNTNIITLDGVAPGATRKSLEHQSDVISRIHI